MPAAGDERAGLKRRPGCAASVCPHYPNCVGCPTSDLPYPEQLRRKRQRLLDALRARGLLAGLDVPEVTASPRRLGYRGRVKLVVRRSGGEVALGLYVPGTHRVIDVASCPVHPRPVNRVAHYVKKKLIELKIAPYDERDDTGDLRYLDFRYSFARRELSLTLVTRRPEFPQGAALARSVQRRFSFVLGIIQNINPERGNVIWGRSFRTLGGHDTIEERIGLLKLHYPAGVFSQANPFTARRVYEAAIELAGLRGEETVVDLYCGVGPVALYAAPGARLVYAIDDHERSVAAAKQNARSNGIGNCRFFAGEIAAELERIRRSAGPIDVCILNPPRKGAHSGALQALLDAAPRRIVYISCDPGSLTRDLEHAVGRGYRLVRLRPFDMFPQTDQVETVAQLNRSDVEV